MLITPQQVIDYTDFDAVKNRTPEKLNHDIIQAQADVFKHCGHKFTDAKYTPLSEEVKLALIKLAEFYALVNSDESIAKGYKSEKIGDYSYSLSDGTSITKPMLDTLLADYVQEATVKGGIRLRMRSV